MPKKLTQAEFVAKAHAVHGVGKYDYSEVVYERLDIDVTIHCPVHGPFLQKPDTHLQKKGCPACGRKARAEAARRRDTASFISEARAVFGDEYDYSETVYLSNKKWLTVICRKHGPYSLRANSHLSGSRCKKCVSDSNTYSTADFIAKARAKHSDKYDYSQAEYRLSRDAVAIICPVHGAFFQQAGRHLMGHGCPKCARKPKQIKPDSGKARLKIDTNEFIRRAQAVHGTGVYDYSKCIYQSAKSKVIIGCKAHGLFKQGAFAHMDGRGCWRCFRIRLSALRTKGATEFIDAAREAHGEKYNYSKTAYKGFSNKVIITCPIHGDFEQAPGSHLKGHGCSLCGFEGMARSWVERSNGRAAVLYFVKLFNGNEKFYKVGVTVHSVAHRFRDLHALSGYQYEVLAQHYSADAAAVYEWEQSILETFAHLRHRPKKHFIGATECFSSCEEILEIFPL